MNAPWNEAIPTMRITPDEDHNIKFPTNIAFNAPDEVTVMFLEIIFSHIKEILISKCDIFGGDNVDLSSIPYLFIDGDLVLGNNAKLGLVYATGNIILGDNAQALSLISKKSIECGDFARILAEEVEDEETSIRDWCGGKVFAQQDIFFGIYSEVEGEILGTNNYFDDFSKLLSFVEARQDNNFGTHIYLENFVWAGRDNNFGDYVNINKATAGRDNNFGSHAETGDVEAGRNNQFGDYATIIAKVEAGRNNIFGNYASIRFTVTAKENNIFGNFVQTNEMYSKQNTILGKKAKIFSLNVGGCAIIGDGSEITSLSISGTTLFGKKVKIGK